MATRSSKGVTKLRRDSKKDMLLRSLTDEERLRYETCKDFINLEELAAMNATDRETALTIAEGEQAEYELFQRAKGVDATLSYKKWKNLDYMEQVDLLDRADEAEAEKEQAALAKSAKQKFKNATSDRVQVANRVVLKKDEEEMRSSEKVSRGTTRAFLRKFLEEVSDAATTEEERFSAEEIEAIMANRPKKDQVNGLVLDLYTKVDVATYDDEGEVKEIYGPARIPVYFTYDDKQIIEFAKKHGYSEKAAKAVVNRRHVRGLAKIRKEAVKIAQTGTWEALAKPTTADTREDILALTKMVQLMGSKAKTIVKDEEKAKEALEKDADAEVKIRLREKFSKAMENLAIKLGVTQAETNTTAANVRGALYRLGIPAVIAATALAGGGYGVAQAVAPANIEPDHTIVVPVPGGDHEEEQQPGVTPGGDHQDDPQEVEHPYLQASEEELATLRTALNGAMGEQGYTIKSIYGVSTEQKGDETLHNLYLITDNNKGYSTLVVVNLDGNTNTEELKTIDDLCGAVQDCDSSKITAMNDHTELFGNEKASNALRKEVAKAAGLENADGQLYASVAKYNGTQARLNTIYLDDNGNVVTVNDLFDITYNKDGAGKGLNKQTAANVMAHIMTKDAEFRPSVAYSSTTKNREVVKGVCEDAQAQATASKEDVWNVEGLGTVAFDKEGNLTKSTIDVSDREL